MRAALPPAGFAPRNASLIQRSATLAAVIALHLLLLFLLLRLAPPPVPPPPSSAAPISVRLLPDAAEAPARTQAAEAARPQIAREEPAVVPEPQPVPPVPPPPALPPRPSIWSQVVPLTRQELAAADLARLPTHPPAQAGRGGGERGAAQGEGGGDTAGPGKGPNGETLYNAQWYRRPTNAELSTYIPSGAPRTGWGVIACETVANYRVDNCVEIAQSPAGSGLAGAVRQAAWQFRVLPPRIGGRPMVGAWVRIRIDYSSEGVE